MPTAVRSVFLTPFTTHQHLLVHTRGARVVNGHSSQCGSSFLLINHTSRFTRCMTVTKESVVLMQSGMSTYLVLFASRSKLLFAVHF